MPFDSETAPKHARIFGGSPVSGPFHHVSGRNTFPVYFFDRPLPRQAKGAFGSRAVDPLPCRSTFLALRRKKARIHRLTRQRGAWPDRYSFFPVRRVFWSSKCSPLQRLGFCAPAHRRFSLVFSRGIPFSLTVPDVVPRTVSHPLSRAFSTG